MTAADDGKLVGDGFVIDHVVRGDSIEEVLSRSSHQVTTWLMNQHTFRVLGLGFRVL